MARINKVLCDKCKAELETDYFKLMVSKSTKDTLGYATYLSVDRIDLCKKCYEEFTTKFLNQERNK